MTDILLLDQSDPHLDTATARIQAVRADALRRMLCYQGDDCRLVLCCPGGATSDIEPWLDLLAIEAMVVEQDAVEPIPSPATIDPAAWRQLQAAVCVSGDVEWWGHGPPLDLPVVDVARHHRLLAMANELLHRQGVFARPQWRLLAGIGERDAWRHALILASEQGMVLPSSVHVFSLTTSDADADAGCCPRCGAITAGLSSERRRLLCALPGVLADRLETKPTDDGARPSLPFGFAQAVLACDTGDALAELHGELLRLDEWYTAANDMPLRREQAEQLATQRVAHLRALARWLELLIPLPTGNEHRIPSPTAQGARVGPD